MEDEGAASEIEEQKSEEEIDEEAAFEEEGEKLVLDDFFRGGDAGDELVGVEGGAGTAEADAEEEAGRGEVGADGTGVAMLALEADDEAGLRVAGGGEPGAEGGRVEAEANVGGFGDVAGEIRIF